jgi:quinol monooxygenase YgiN
VAPACDGPDWGATAPSGVPSTGIGKSARDGRSTALTPSHTAAVPRPARRAELRWRLNVAATAPVCLGERQRETVISEPQEGGLEMVTLVVFHNVADYDRWKPVFDEHEAVRRSHGQLEHRVYRSVDDPNRVVVHNDYPSEEAARAFMDDPSLPAAMERAGVTGEPWLGLIERVERRRYADGDVGVTMAVHHRVRDYDAWKQVFDEHEEARRRHGQLEHRIYHAFGDPLQLVVHNDFPTFEAAEAFGADPSLREAMARAGVEGEPGINVITLAERVSYS